MPPRRHHPTDPDTVIRANLPLTPVPGIPEIRLHLAQPGSRLSGMIGPGAAPPYWAYPWAGGLALARYLLDRPEVVRDRRVLDLGAGSGLVAVAAAKAGARDVMAAEVDPNGVAAIPLNAAANGVEVCVIAQDLLEGPVPDTDLVLVGDLFYSPTLARRVTAFLDRCVGAGRPILVGDPGRIPLPRHRLIERATYPVTDFGDRHAADATVYAFA